jgi:hypothetical protein
MQAEHMQAEQQPDDHDLSVLFPGVKLVPVVTAQIRKYLMINDKPVFELFQVPLTQPQRITNH